MVMKLHNKLLTIYCTELLKYKTSMYLFYIGVKEA